DGDADVRRVARRPRREGRPMTEDGRRDLEERILLLTPTVRDAAASRDLLTAAGLGSTVCADLAELCGELERGAGAAVVPAEALLNDRAGRLPAVLQAQPPWSDVPLLVLTPAGAESPETLRALRSLGNMTLIKRPVQLSAF